MASIDPSTGGINFVTDAELQQQQSKNSKNSNDVNVLFDPKPSKYSYLLNSSITFHH